MVQTGGDVPAVSWSRVHAFRLRRHHLARPARRTDLVSVAGDVCGVQAQIPSAARLALRARTRGLRAADVDRALAEERTLVEATCMRGTRHLLPSRDLAVFLRACDRRGAQWTAWFVKRKWPIDALDKILEAMAEAMDRPRTRAELLDHVKDALGIRTQSRRMSHGWGNVKRTEGLEVGDHLISIGNMIGYACVRGIACCGPSREGEATFVRPDAWIPGYRDVPVPEAKAEIVRRYLRAYGPSNPQDMATWASLAVADVRSVWASMADEISEVVLDGRPAWLLREDLAVLQRAKVDGPVVRLLPYFDSYLMGHRDRGHLAGPAHHGRISRPAGWIAAVVLVDGRVEGTWRHSQGKGTVEVRVEPFGRFSGEVKEGVEAEAADLGRFLEAPARVAYG